MNIQKPIVLHLLITELHCVVMFSLITSASVLATHFVIATWCWVTTGPATEHPSSSTPATKATSSGSTTTRSVVYLLISAGVKQVSE